ncbi:MAG: hypothetical protein IJT12_09685 [Paludibacteraceae bacterium]|nr:hypothetical protein [Paludibacteraceae bacterium]
MSTYDKVQAMLCGLTPWERTLLADELIHESSPTAFATEYSYRLYVEQCEKRMQESTD